MNEKIVIIGNGFDLRHYLPTKYNHLITMLREIEGIDFTNNGKIAFSKLFSGKFKDGDEKFYDGIVKYYDTKKIKFDAEKLLSIKERVKANNWFQYLKSVEDDKIETWIDFETEINRVLNITSNYFEQFTLSQTSSPEYGDFQDGSFFYFKLYEKEKFVANNLQIQALSYFNLFDTKSEIGFCKLNSKFILSIENKIQYFKEKEFYNSIYESLEEFIGVFNDYVIIVINEFYRNFREEKMEEFIKLDTKYLFDQVSKIFSFNYTNTFEKLYNDERSDAVKRNLVKNNLPVVCRGVDFLHGKAIEGWGENLENLEIVLGVDEIENSLKGNKLFQFTKYFQKLHKNTDYLFLDDILKTANKTRTKINDGYSFYFWGHSLDVSDRDYINDVFQIIGLSKECEVKIFYHSISSKADLLKNLLSVIADKNTIERFMKSGQLQFIESTSENLFKELA